MAWLLPTCCLAQTGTWQTLTGAPNQLTGRHDDIFFVNDSTGWLVNNTGKIYRTGDMGNSWNMQCNQPGTYFRCIGFAGPLNGWAGNLGAQSWGGATDTNCLYETHNGGMSWSPVTTISGTKPMGICGLNVLDAQHIFATGRIEGPVCFAKTTDSGLTWQSQDMSAYCGDLVDVKFFSPDTGFIVGGTNADFFQSHGIILKTVDGGSTWQTQYVTTDSNTWCWKQSWPSHQTGYVSLQTGNNQVNFIKTTDGGTTWSEFPLTSQNYFCQGIGFVNDTTGWIGGDFNNPVSFQTTDGGLSWTTVTWGARLNRFRFTSDSTGYACGQKAYRYSNNLTWVPEAAVAVNGYLFKMVSADPEAKTVTVQYTIPVNADVNIDLYDLAGRNIRSLLQEKKLSGYHELKFSVPPSINGIFFCSFSSRDFQKSITLFTR